jgi:hypothetical protein
VRSPFHTPDLLGTADTLATTQTTTSSELVVVSRDGELRILDTDLAARLGFERPRKIRELIAPHRGALSQLGDLATADVVVGKGQRATAYYLNKRQAIFLTAKSETAEATAITIEIIDKFDAYERGAIRSPAPLPARRGVTAREAASTFRAYRGIAKLIGLDENQAALSAARATKLETGIDPLAQLGITHLLAPQQQLLLTPSDIGVRLGGKSAIAVNKLLAERGFQVTKRDGKGHSYWEPTSAGEPHATLLDTGKRQGNGTPIRQLKWTAGIVGLLTEGTVQ